MLVQQPCRAAPATVWNILTDLDRFAEVTDVVRLERLDDGNGFDVGTRWRETRKMFGREATEEMWVTEVDPGREYVVEAASHGARYRSVLEVAPTETGSVLSMQFVGTGTNLFTKVLAGTVGRLLEESSRRAMQADLAGVAEAAEADEADEADQSAAAS